MAALAEHLNVFDTAVDILTKKGFQVWYDKPADLYYAERDGWDFASPTPVGLLGVVAIFEHVKPTTYAEYWWKSPKVGLRRNLPATPPSQYVPVYKRSKGPQ
jgi:hypothetical protein